MPSSLSETSTFDATVSVPTDGDDLNAASAIPAWQAVVNRTRNLKDRLDAARFGRATMTGALTLVPGGQKVQLSLAAAAGATVVADQLITPATGLYQIHARAVGKLYNLSAVAGDPAGLELRINGALIQTVSAYSFDGAEARLVCLTLGGTYQLSLNDAIDVRAGSVPFVVVEGELSIVKVLY